MSEFPLAMALPAGYEWCARCGAAKLPHPHEEPLPRRQQHCTIRRWIATGREEWLLLAGEEHRQEPPF